MALIDKASLLMVPSTYEDGTLYNILPSGNKAPDETGNHNAYDQTRADFTFSRGSNLTATRVNANGLIEKGRENLLLQSEAFSASWSAFSATATTGQSGYDGTTNALLLTSTGNYARIQQAASSTGIMTASCYMKAGTTSWGMIRVAGSGYNITQYFDLENGVIGSLAGVSASINLVSDGWYRCEVVANVLATPTFYIYTALADGNLSVTDETITIQSPQLEKGLVATTFIPTTTTTAKAGVLENMPRIDYLSGAGALLLEGLRTNLYTYSEYYDSYTKVNLSITTNAITSPEGIQNASKLVSGTGLNIKRIQPSISTTGTNEYVISAFVKKAEWDYFFIYGAGTLVNGAQAIFNLNTGTIEEGSGHSTMEAFGDDGWYKITWKATSTGTGTGDPRIGITDNASSSNSTGDGVSGVYLYGLQIEEASHASSYIPTMGTAASRAADYMNTTPTDLLGSTTGSWFMEMDDMTFEVTGTSVPTIYLGDDVSNCLAIEGRNAGNNKSVFLVKEEGGTVTTLHGFTISGKTKFCFVWNGTTLKVFRDGTEEYSSTSFTQPTNWDTFVYNHTGREAFSEIANIQLYDTALSDSEAQTLTTL